MWIKRQGRTKILSKSSTRLTSSVRLIGGRVDVAAVVAEAGRVRSRRGEATNMLV